MIRILFLIWFGLTTISAVQARSPEANRAIEKSLKVLEKAVDSYPNHRDCFSCHHQAMPSFALTEAKAKGFQIKDRLLPDLFEFSTRSFSEKLSTISEGKGLGGGNSMAAFALATFTQSEDKKYDAIRKSLADFLVRRQREDGSWPAITPRPPTEGSRFTNAFLAIGELNQFRDHADPDFAQSVQRAIDRGSKWLKENEPESMEDRVYHLRGLVRIQADRKVIDKFRDALMEFQTKEGSWSQLPKMDGDAYATSTALIALQEAGISPKSDAYRLGIGYLIKNQDATGAWIVQTRSRPIQTYFDNGDPGGKSQFMTIAATSWATIALLRSEE